MASLSETFSRRYAKALLEVIVETKGEEVSIKLQKQLDDLVQLLSQGEGVRFFESPIFDQKEKLEILNQILSKQPTHEALERFLRVLVSQGHLKFLKEISSQYAQAQRERKNEAKAFVRSAFPLSVKDRERLSQALEKATGKKISLEESVDKELIGGVVTSVGGVVYDASIRGYLNRLQEEFVA